MMDRPARLTSARTAPEHEMATLTVTAMLIALAEPVSLFHRLFPPPDLQTDIFHSWEFSHQSFFFNFLRRYRKRRHLPRRRWPLHVYEWCYCRPPFVFQERRVRIRSLHWEWWWLIVITGQQRCRNMRLCRWKSLGRTDVQQK